MSAPLRDPQPLCFACDDDGEVDGRTKATTMSLNAVSAHTRGLLYSAPVYCQCTTWNPSRGIHFSDVKKSDQSYQQNRTFSRSPLAFDLKRPLSPAGPEHSAHQREVAREDVSATERSRLKPQMVPSLGSWMKRARAESPPARKDIKPGSGATAANATARVSLLAARHRSTGLVKAGDKEIMTTNIGLEHAEPTKLTTTEKEEASTADRESLAPAPKLQHRWMPMEIPSYNGHVVGFAHLRFSQAAPKDARPLAATQPSQITHKLKHLLEHAHVGLEEECSQPFSFFNTYEETRSVSRMLESSSHPLLVSSLRKNPSRIEIGKRQSSFWSRPRPPKNDTSRSGDLRRYHQSHESHNGERSADAWYVSSRESPKGNPRSLLAMNDGGEPFQLQDAEELNSLPESLSATTGGPENGDGDKVAADNAPLCLKYRVPEAKLRKIMSVSPTSSSAYWRYSLYENEEGEKPKVHYCTSLASVERITHHFTEKDVIGFDLEWKPNATTRDPYWQNVSLIQIACEDRIALFHVAQCAEVAVAADIIPDNLRQLLESPLVRKVGVNIKGDASRMRQHFGINMCGVFELCNLHKLVKYCGGTAKQVQLINKSCGGASLATQVQEHLQLPLLKDAIRTSNWAERLTPSQIQYAASDAYASLQVYYALEAKRLALEPMPPRPDFVELNLPIRLANDLTVKEWVKLYPDEEASSATDDAEPPATPPEVLEAETWASAFRERLNSPHWKAKLTPAKLKAYRLWHKHAMDVSEICALKDPPLQNTTVATYIKQVVVSRTVPFDSERYEEVKALLPDLSGQM